MKRTLWSAGAALAALLLSGAAGAAPLLSTQIVCPVQFQIGPMVRGVAKVSKGGDLSLDIKSGFPPNQTISCSFFCFSNTNLVFAQPNCGASDAAGRVRVRVPKAINVANFCPNPFMTFTAFAPQQAWICTPGFGGQ